MFKKSFSPVLFAVAASFALVSCSKDDEPIAPETPATIGKFRTAIPAGSYTDTSAYKMVFASNGDTTTVDFKEGNDRYNMFAAISSYNRNSTAFDAVLDANVLKVMFANIGDPFYGTHAYLNSSTVDLRNVTGGTQSNAEQIRTRIESHFDEIALASQSAGAAASEGTAGIYSTTNGTTVAKYLVDENGVEWAQVIAKSLIGAYQLDYICNTLLSEPSLSADNTKVMDGKKVSQLEYNWDQAYAHLTVRPVFLSAINGTSSGEANLGSYLFEYNKDGYAKVYPAFLKGRAAIVNGDKATVMAQAAIIRTEFERAIVASAAGYLKKVKDEAVDVAKRAHAYGEGVGFIYSLRFCKTLNISAAQSDEILNLIDFNTTGIYQLSNSELQSAIDKVNDMKK